MNILTSIVLSFLIANVCSANVGGSKRNLLREHLGWNDADHEYETTESGNELKEASFECRTSGMYPDPFDCNRYHHCARHGNDGDWNKTPLEHFSDTCNCGYAYNSRTTFCDISIRNNGTCNNNPITTCEHPGQNGRMEHNPSLYFICQYHHQNGQLYPFMYACEHGRKYNAYKYLCE
ncbi:hypothetical protein PPYR_13737 [Photinus pyralis]|uniref:Chitin-binding type-2 domain-containing protein n=1 Tax=Photinus pyralis TaxID=7054 RepID=A0A5N4A9X7_PHOPY|nr:uncharacterized protein LOC116177625 [Photinus pyralis]XP_031352495.1 uncharacterized protein LOC116177626 [Photinus pyralis]KAB0794117.1 hypothetical protein PPYR_13737 [Photinus pyralis]